MATLTSWALIYVAPKSDPAVDRVVIERAGVRSTLVAVPEPAAAVDVAVELVDGGAELIELDGPHGPEWTAKVLAAIGGRVPVGFVTFGAESTDGLAAFKARHRARQEARAS